MIKNHQTKRKLFLISTILFLTLSISQSGSAGTPAIWQTTTSTGCPTNYQSKTEHNGDIYILSTGSTFFRYNTSTGNCTPLASTLPSSNSYLTSFDSNTIALLTGGYTRYYLIDKDFWISEGDISKSKNGTESPISQSGSTQSLGALGIAKPGSDEIYVFAGNSTNFQRYNFITNNWTPTSGAGSMTQVPANTGSGAAATFVGNNLYLLRGGGTSTFYRYDTSAPLPGSWTTLASLPTIDSIALTANAGASLTTHGGNIYAFVGGNRKYFLKYCVITDSDCSTTNTWIRMPDAPDLIQGGGALTTMGNFIYAFKGNYSKTFWRYNTMSKTWSTNLPNAPQPIASGGSLTNDGTFIYATQGYNEKTFWRFNPSPTAPRWEDLDNAPVQIGTTSLTEARGSITYSNNSNSVYLISGNGSTGTVTSQNNGLIHRFDTPNGTYPNKWAIYERAQSIIGSLTNYAVKSIPSSDFIYAIRANTKNLIKYSKSFKSIIPWPRPLTKNGTELISQFQPYLNNLSELTRDSSNFVELNGSFYIIGQNNYFFRYDVEKNKFFRLANTPASFSSNNGTGFVVLDNNRLGLAFHVGYAEYIIDQDIWILGGEGYDENGNYYKHAPDYSSAYSTNSGTSIHAHNNNLYLIQGGASSGFVKYNLINHTWTELAATPGAITTGGAGVLVNDEIYHFQGGSTNFYKYNINTNTWSTLAPYSGGATGAGASLTWHTGSNYIYATRGGLNQNFHRYNISTNSWEVLANTPETIQGGSAITYINNTTYDSQGSIFATRGNNTNTFWRYCLPGSTGCTPNTWTVITSAPNAFRAGGSLTRVSTNEIYATHGGNTNLFSKYNVNENKWYNLERTPATRIGTISDSQNFQTLTFNPIDGDLYMTPGQVTTTPLTTSPANFAINRYKLSPGPGQYSWIFTPRVRSWIGFTGWSQRLLYSGAGDILYFLGGQGKTESANFNRITREFTGFIKSIATNGEPLFNDTGLLNGSARGLTEHNGTIYLFSGDTNLNFKYNPTSNRWTQINNFPTSSSPTTVKIAKYNSNTFYILLSGGGANELFQYKLDTDTFTQMANPPLTTGGGASIAYPGTGEYLYITRGGYNSTFWRYCLPGSTGCTGNTYQTLTSPSFNISSGSDLIGIDNHIYLTIANGTTDFIRYNIRADSWSTLNSTPAPLTTGSALTTDGRHIYATRGGGQSNFYRYNIATNSWTTLISTPVNQPSTSADLIYIPELNEIYYARGGVRGTNQIECCNEGSAILLRYRIVQNDWPHTTSFISAINPSGTNHFLHGCGAALNKPIDGKFYIIASTSATSCTTTRLLELNPSTHTWTIISEIPFNTGSPNYDTGIGVTIAGDEINKKLYITRGGISKEFYEYNLNTNTWSQLKNTPINIGLSHLNYNSTTTATLFYDNEVWLYAATTTCRNNINVDLTNTCPLFYRYNPSNNSWPIISPAVENTSSDMSGNFLGGSALEATDSNTLYILQGTNSPGTTNFFKYNINNEINDNPWTSLPHFPKNPPDGAPADVQSGGSLARTNDNKIIGTRGKGTTNINIFDLINESWSTYNSIQFPVNIGSATTSNSVGGILFEPISKKLYGNSSSSSTMYVYDLNPKLSLENVNSGNTVYKNTPFTLTLKLIDYTGNPVNLSRGNRNITVSKTSGVGNLTGTLTKTLLNGTNTITFDDLNYDTAENITLSFTANTGNPAITASSHSFTVFNPPPTITSISPSSGATSGKTPVNIIGNNFTPTTIIKFNNKPAWHIIYNSPTSITAYTPPNTTTESVTVTATNPDNQTGRSPTNFIYANPTVTSVNPTSGPTTGGTSVTITGTNFGQNNYFKPIPISNSTGSTLTDIQIPIGTIGNTFNTATLISSNKMRSDCGDLRVFDSDKETLLNYWIQDGTCNTANTTVWVKIPSLPNGGKTIYLNYGNRNFTSQSNGDKVFLFFDNFSGTSIDTTKWLTISGTPTVSGGVVTLNAAEGMSTYHASNPGFTLPSDTIFQSYANKQSPGLIGGAIRASTTSSNGFVGDGGANILDILWWSSNGLYAETNSGETFMGTGATGFKHYKITYRPANADNSIFDYENGTLTTSRSGNNPANTLHPVIYCNNCTTTTNNQVEFDWILARKYASIPPIANTSSAEIYETIEAEFGNQPATSESYISETEISATTPPHPTGTVNVKIINPNSSQGEGTNLFTYITTPSQPLSPYTTAGSNQLTIHWSDPISNGGSAITQYLIYYGPSSGPNSCNPINLPDPNCLLQTANGNENLKLITSLTNGTEYIFAVYAQNAVGISPPSETTTGTPIAGFSKTNSSITASPMNSIEANNIDYSLITVNFKDEDNNNMPGQLVELTSINNEIMLNITAVNCSNPEDIIPGRPLTNSSGNACFKARSIHPGNFEIIAKNFNQGINLDDPEDILQLNFIDTTTYLNQQHYIFRNDDNTEINATSFAPENNPAYNLTPLNSIRLRQNLNRNSNPDKILLTNVLENNTYIPKQGLINTKTNYAYQISNDDPPRIYKYNLSNFTQVGSLNLTTSGEVTASAIDENTNIAYIATYDNGPIITSINLQSGDANPTQINTLALGTSNEIATLLIIDSNKDYGYLITKELSEYLPPQIHKFKLSTFQYLASVKLKIGAGKYYAAALDSENEYFYLLGKNTQIPNASMRLDRIDLDTNELQPPVDVAHINLTHEINSPLHNIAIDTSAGYLYISSDGSPSKLTKILIDPSQPFSELSTLTLPFNNAEKTLSIDTINKYLFITTASTPRKLARIDLKTFTLNQTTDILNLSNTATSPLQLFNEKTGKLYLFQESGPNKFYEFQTTKNLKTKLQFGNTSNSEPSCSNITIWSDLTPSSTSWKLSNSIHLTNLSLTTNVPNLLTDTNNKFQAGQNLESSTESDNLSLGRNQFTEMEFSLTTTEEIDSGKTYCFRILDQSILPSGSSKSINYLQYPSTTIGGISIIETDGNTSVIERTNFDTYTISITNPALLNGSDQIEISINPEEGLSVNQSTIILTQAEPSKQIRVVAPGNETQDGVRTLTISHTITSSTSSYFTPQTSIRTLPVQISDYGSTASLSQVEVISNINFDAPDDFNFPDVLSGVKIPNFFRTAISDEGNNSPNYKLSIQDNRPNGDYRVQVQANTDFSNGTSCIPLSKVYVSTSNLTNSLITPPTEIAPTNITDIENPNQYRTLNRRLATSEDSNNCNAVTQPITLIDTTLTPTDIQDITTIDINYMIDYENINQILNTGEYSMTLTYTLIDNP